MLEQFAEEYSLKTRKDECGHVVITGRSGNVYDGFTSQLGAYLNFGSARKWNSVKRQLEQVGCAVRQNGDTDGCLTFNPDSEAQARAVIRLVRLKTRRTPSEAQLAVLARLRESRTIQTTA
jgi:hypothetical protein